MQKLLWATFFNMLHDAYLNIHCQLRIIRRVVIFPDGKCVNAVAIVAANPQLT